MTRRRLSDPRGRRLTLALCELQLAINSTTALNERRYHLRLLRTPPLRKREEIASPITQHPKVLRGPAGLIYNNFSSNGSHNQEKFASRPSHANFGEFRMSQSGQLISPFFHITTSPPFAFHPPVPGA
jgi:hypothetical protein